MRVVLLLVGVCACVTAAVACSGSDATVDASDAAPDVSAADAAPAPDDATLADVESPLDAAPDGRATDAANDAGADGATDASDGASDAATDASDGGGGPDAGTECTSDPRCADGGGGCFVLVPGSGALGTSDFCVAAFEMKAKDGGVTSAADGPPVIEPTRANAAAACAAMGCALPTNVQWQTLAQNIELVAKNWSGGAVGSGALARGHSDATPNAPLAVANTADPCDGTGNPACANGASADFSQRRTHVLSTGSAVWDVAGNVLEWVADDQSPPQYFVDYAGRLSGADAALFGPSGTYTVGPRPDLSNQYPSNGLVQPGALAVIEGQNFDSGTIWVRAGATLLVRGTNFSGAVKLEPNASFVNIGSNILGNGPRVASTKTVVDGNFNPTSTQDIDATKCDGTCPAGTQTFSADAARGLGMTIIYGNVFPNESIARGGHLGYGPMSGVFTAIAFPYSKFIGYRCVKPPS